MFKLMGKEINAILGAKTILIWTYDSHECLLKQMNWQNMTEDCSRKFLALEAIEAKC